MLRGISDPHLQEEVEFCLHSGDRELRCADSTQTTHLGPPGAHCLL